MLHHFVGHTWGASKSMTKVFQTMSALVQEQVNTWVIVSLFVMILDAPPPPPPAPGMVDKAIKRPWNWIGLLTYL